MCVCVCVCVCVYSFLSVSFGPHVSILCHKIIGLIPTFLITIDITEYVSFH